LGIKVTAPLDNIESNDVTRVRSNRKPSFKAFGMNSGNNFGSKRMESNNAFDLNEVKRKRRQSFMPSQSGSTKGIGTLKRGDIYGGDAKGAPSGIRRSFMGNSMGISARKSSVNRSKKRDEDGDSIGTDYSDDDNKDLEYRQRNKDLYKTLRKIGV
jgi:hypothetical protein